MPAVTIISDDELVKKLKKFIKTNKVTLAHSSFLQVEFFHHMGLNVQSSKILHLLNKVYPNKLIRMDYVGECNPKHFCYIDQYSSFVYFSNTTDAINYKLLVL